MAQIIRSICIFLLLTIENSLTFGESDVLTCLECYEVETPRSCKSRVLCGKGEICYTREFKDQFGGRGFHLGCEDKIRCDLYINTHKLVGRHNKRTESHMCYECCNTNDCNSIACVNSTDCNTDVNTDTWCVGKPGGKDCSNILKKNASAPDGIYTIDPGDGQGPFRVFCDMTTDGGGWVVFQRRKDGSEDFFRTWNDYKNGFGQLSGEFYLGFQYNFSVSNYAKQFKIDMYTIGNERVHRLSSMGAAILRIDLEDFHHHTAYATYNQFYLGNDTSSYKLSLGAYSGTAGNSLTFENGMGFTTKDRNVDMSPSNCAQQFHGAWWYYMCYQSNLNGEYNNTNYGQGITWSSWKGYYYSLYRTEMKLRSRS